jgi:hypothetical protein
MRAEQIRYENHAAGVRSMTGPTAAERFPVFARVLLDEAEFGSEKPSVALVGTQSAFAIARA